MYEEGTLNKKLIIIGIILGLFLIIGLILFIITKPKPTIKEFNTKHIKVGQKYQVDIDHIEKSLDDLEFLTSNDKVATINKKGVVIGKSSGRVTIIIKDRKYDYVTQDIEVEDLDFIEISLISESLEVELNKEFDINKNIENIEKLEGIEYSIRNTQIASINEKGILKGLKEGNTVLNIKTNDKTEVSCKITVKNKKEVKKQDVVKEKEEKISTSNTSKKSTTTSKTTKKNNTVAVKGLNLNTSSKTLYTNYPNNSSNTFKLIASVVPSNANNKTISYSSSNPKVASVNSSGVVTAKEAGTAYITAKTNNGIKKTATIVVRVSTKSIDYTVSTAILRSTGHDLTNNTAMLSANFNPANTYFKTIDWRVNDTSIANITKKTSNTALLTIKKPGVIKVSALTSGNPTLRKVEKSLTIRGLIVKIWQNEGTVYERTRSSINFNYNPNSKINFKLNIFPSLNTLSRSDLTVNSSNSNVLSCPSGYSYCNVKGKGTTYLRFTYNHDTRYKTFVKVIIS